MDAEQWDKATACYRRSILKPMGFKEVYVHYTWEMFQDHSRQAIQNEIEQRKKGAN